MKELRSKVVIMLFFGFILLLSCSNSRQDSDSHKDMTTVSNYIKLNQHIVDTLTKYLSGISDSCHILIKVDRSYIHKTLRLNVIPISRAEIKMNNLLYTTINERNVFINTSIEDLLASPDTEDIINCDSTFFVLYDSLGFISVKENLNDYDDDLRPSQQLDFRLNEKEK